MRLNVVYHEPVWNHDSESFLPRGLYRRASCAPRPERENIALHEYGGKIFTNPSEGRARTGRLAGCGLRNTVPAART